MGGIGEFEYQFVELIVEIDMVAGCSVDWRIAIARVA
jgi:hypothetical protein